MKTSKCLVVTAPNRMELREFPIPEIGPREMLLRVEMVSICGGEPKKYDGSSMWVGEWGGMPYPLILGHEVVGFLEKVGHIAGKLQKVKEGDRVIVEPYIPCGHCRYCGSGNYQVCENRITYGTSVSCDKPPHLWGGYSEYMFVAEGSKVHKIESSVPPEAACLTSVIGNGVRWVKTKGELKFGETIVVLGPGAQGLATVISAQKAGAHRIIIFGLGCDASKLKLAQEFGASHVFNLEDTDVVTAVREVTAGEMADVVVECTGSPSSIRVGANLLRPLGRYVIIGATGSGKEVGLKTDPWVINELTIRGGLGQSWNCEDAARIINSRQFAIDKMITHVYPLERGEDAMLFFMKKDPECIRVALRP